MGARRDWRQLSQRQSLGHQGREPARKYSAGSIAAAAPRQTIRRNRGARFIVRSGSGFQPAMVRAHACACALSVMPGNRRRSSPTGLLLVTSGDDRADRQIALPRVHLGQHCPPFRYRPGLSCATCAGSRPRPDRSSAIMIGLSEAYPHLLAKPEQRCAQQNHGGEEKRGGTVYVL